MKQRSANGLRDKIIIAMSICIFAIAVPISAAPTRGELRLSIHIGLSNAYLIDSNRLNAASDIFTIALDELDQQGTTSSVHLFAFGAFAQLQYGLSDNIAVGFRTGFEDAFAGGFVPPGFRIPLIFSANFTLVEWLELQPEIGLNITYNPYHAAQKAGPNLDVGLRLRILDRIDLHGGFLHGTVSGFHFSVSVRLFDIPLPKITPEATPATSGEATP